MSAHCIAYREDGCLCRRTATIFDRQRGGMVCAQHAPDPELPLRVAVVSSAQVKAAFDRLRRICDREEP